MTKTGFRDGLKDCRRIKWGTNNNKITEVKVSKAKLWMLNLLHKFKSSWLSLYWLEIPLYLSFIGFILVLWLTRPLSQSNLYCQCNWWISEQIHCSVKSEVFTPSIHFLHFYLFFIFFARLLFTVSKTEMFWNCTTDEGECRSNTPFTPTKHIYAGFRWT